MAWTWPHTRKGQRGTERLRERGLGAYLRLVEIAHQCHGIDKVGYHVHTASLQPGFEAQIHVRILSDLPRTVSARQSLLSQERHPFRRPEILGQKHASRTLVVGEQRSIEQIQRGA